MGIIYFKSDTCDLVLACDHLQIIMLYTGYVIQAYFTLTFLTKYIVIFRIWMDNWGILFANLEQVQKQTSRGVLTKGCSENMQQTDHAEKNTYAEVRSNFTEITLRYGCSPVNLLYIFKTHFLRTPLDDCFCKWFEKKKVECLEWFQVINKILIKKHQRRSIYATYQRTSSKGL